MINNSLKVFFKSLKFSLIPVLSIALFTGIGFLVVYFMSKGMISDAKEKIEAVIGSFSASVDDFLNFLGAKINEVNGGIFGVVQYIFSGKFIDAIMEFIAQYNSASSAYSDEIKEILLSYESSFTSIIWVFSVFVIVGVVIGYFVTGTLIKKMNFKRKLSKTIIVMLFDLAVTAGAVYLVAWAGSALNWNVGAYFIAVGTALFYFGLALIEAYLAQKDDKLKLFDVFNAKNILLLFLVYVIIIAIAVGMVLLFNLIPLKIVALALIYSIVIVTVIDLGIMAESYVATLVQSK